MTVRILAAACIALAIIAAKQANRASRAEAWAEAVEAEAEIWIEKAGGYQ